MDSEHCLVQKYVHNGRRRSKDKESSRTKKQQLARTNIRKQSFAVIAVEKWNSLTDWVRVEEKT